MLLDHHSRGAAGRNRPLNTARLLKENIPVPSREAQARIEFVLEQEYAVAQSVKRLVGIIREYRARLGADIVTGKLDVREAAAQLPEGVNLSKPGQERGIGELEDEGGIEVGIDEVAEAAGT